MPIYNPVTDALDIYSNGVIVGSIPCYFQEYSLITDDSWVQSSTGGTPLVVKNETSLKVQNTGVDSATMCYTRLTTDYIDFSIYKYIDMIGSSQYTYDGSIKIYIINSTGSIVGTLLSSVNVNNPVNWNTTVDVSSYYGNHKLQIEVGASWNYAIYVNFKKLLLRKN